MTLELQAAFPGGLGQRLDAAVILESRTIERDRVDASGLRLLRDALADQRGCRAVAAVLDVLTYIGLEAGSARQNLVTAWRDDLRVNVAVRPRDHQAVRALLGDAHPRLAAASCARFSLVHLTVLRFLFRRFTSSSFP